jgi:hypothetical protein
LALTFSLTGSLKARADHASLADPRKLKALAGPPYYGTALLEMAHFLRNYRNGYKASGCIAESAAGGLTPFAQDCYSRRVLQWGPQCKIPAAGNPLGTLETGTFTPAEAFTSRRRLDF